MHTQTHMTHALGPGREEAGGCRNLGEGGHTQDPCHKTKTEPSGEQTIQFNRFLGNAATLSHVRSVVSSLRVASDHGSYLHHMLTGLTCRLRS